MVDSPARRAAIEEVQGWSLVQVAGWHDSTATIEEDIARACGIPAPRLVGEVARVGSVILIRVGPGRIWIVDEVGDTAVRLAGAMDTSKGCVTSLGEGRRLYRLSGDRLADVLASLVALDLASPAIAPGRAASTMMHRVPVLLHRVSISAVDLYVPATFARSLEEWIRGAIGSRSDCSTGDR